MDKLSDKKIVVVQNLDLLPDQVERLKRLGDVTIYEDVPQNSKEWLRRVEDAEIICSDFGDTKENIYKTKDKYYALPFVNIGWLDKKQLEERNICVSNAPGCNKLAVSEWIIMMTLATLRRFFEFANVDDLPQDKTPDMMTSLAGKKVLILGKGNIGTTVGKMFESFLSQVDYFSRGDDLITKVKAAQIIVNCLGTNLTTNKILNRDFFMSLTRGSYFITVTSSDVYDGDAMIEALDAGILAGAADDCASTYVGETSGDYYQRVSKHPKIIATPHIAFHTDVTARTANDIMIDNIEAWIKGSPQNLY